MSERGPIVCATDLSPTGGEAVEIAARMAASTGRELRLLHVTASQPDLSAPPQTEAERVYRDRVLRRLEAAKRALEKERLRAEGFGPRCVATLRSGRPWQAVVDAASEAQASLVVVGPHGHGGPQTSRRRDLSEWILGSTADRVLRNSPCPVLIGPRGEEGARPISGGTWLVAVDFSPPSRAALVLAKDLAARCDASLEVLHVADDPLLRLDPAGDEEPFPPLGEIATNTVERRREELHEFVKEALRASPEIRIRAGEPATEIALCAAEIDARLVIMGTHGRSGVAYFLLGSTAERTARACPAPLLCVRD